MSIVDLALRKAGVEASREAEKKGRESISDAIARLTEVVEVDRLAEAVKAMAGRDKESQNPLAIVKDLGFDMKTQIEAMQSLAKESREREESERERADRMQLALFETLAKMMETRESKSTDLLEAAKFVATIMGASQQQLQELQKELLELKTKPQKDPMTESMVGLMSNIVQQAIAEKLNPPPSDPFAQAMSVLQNAKSLMAVLQPARPDPRSDELRLQVDLKRIELEHQLAMHRLEREIELERQRSETYARLAQQIGQLVAQAAPLLMGGRQATMTAGPPVGGQTHICPDCGHEYPVPAGQLPGPCPRCQAQALRLATPNGHHNGPGTSGWEV